MNKETWHNMWTMKKEFKPMHPKDVVSLLKNTKCVNCGHSWWFHRRNTQSCGLVVCGCKSVEDELDYLIFKLRGEKENVKSNRRTRKTKQNTST